MEHDALTREDADRPSTCESGAANEGPEAPAEGSGPESGRRDGDVPASEPGDDAGDGGEPEPGSDPDANAADDAGEPASASDTGASGHMDRAEFDAADEFLFGALEGPRGGGSGDRSEPFVSPEDALDDSPDGPDEESGDQDAPEDGPGDPDRPDDDPGAAVEVPWTHGDRGSLPRRAVRAARSWVAAHQGATAGIVAVLVVAVVAGGFVFAFSRVLAKDRVVPRGEKAVAEELQPVENAELPHLGMRVTSISTAAAPSVTVSVHLEPPAGEALPQLAQESFALSESSGEGDPASVAATGFSYDAATGSCTIAYATAVADPAARRTLTISLAPESGYRGSCSITYSCA